MKRARRDLFTRTDALVLRAMQALGLRRVAVSTAYIDDVNDRLASFLAASGVEATMVRGSR